MENKDKFLDANGNEIKFESSDFTLVQRSKVIHDKGFDTKPTTFFADAMKRFAKNKSSVVAAIIIGIIILLSIFVPVINKHDVQSSQTYQSFLSPKLFNNGHFWSGKRKFAGKKALVYNLNNDKIANEDIKTDLCEIISINTSYTNVASSYTKGGTFALTSSETSASYFGTKEFLYLPEDNVVVTIKLATSDDLKEYIDLSTTYTIYARYYDSTVSDYAVSTIAENVSDTVKTFELKNYFTEKKPNFQIFVKANSVKNSEKNYVLIDSFKMNSNNSTLNATLDAFEIVSNNDDKVITNGASAQISGDKINVNGNTLAINALSATAEVYYDEYEAVFGDQIRQITQEELNSYVKAGWMTYKKPAAGKNVGTYTKLSDKCPINSIEKEVTLGSVKAYECNVSMYKYYGYSSSPKFLAGTDVLGRDMFKYAFLSLRTSLIVAFVITAINFTIGIIYGSIEGYFGGNVDLFMERVTDILGYMPTIVILTLLMNKFGKTVTIFAFGLIFTGWLGVAGRTRTQFYRFKGREYVLASRTLGAKNSRLIAKHILPNALGTIITMSVLMVPGVISTEATLSYIGLGLQGTDTFGVILSGNQSNLSTNPVLVLFPASIMSLMMISFNLFGNGLRDAFNPSLKGSE